MIKISNIRGDLTNISDTIEALLLSSKLPNKRMQHNDAMACPR